MKSSLRILHLEDDKNEVELAQAKLEDEGFTCDVTHVETQADFVAALDKCGFDIILADYKLPSFDGLSALAIAREKTPDVPFIFFSGVMGEELAIETLKTGATDYVLKQRLSQLVPAIRRALKETEQHLERKKAEEALRRIEWLLKKKSTVDSSEAKQVFGQPYGNLSKLNTARLILDSIGEEVLSDVVSDYLNLLETSSAIYEKNGDYAIGIFSSGWCRFLDYSSRKLCRTTDNREALHSRLWNCHESCWNEASRISIETGKPVDIECRGGIYLYAVPIFAGSEIIGSINFGYGDPPKDIEKLKEIALRYRVSVEELRMHSSSYESRPFFITDLAKNRLLASARMIGEIVNRRRAEKELEKQYEHLEELIEERTAEVKKTNEKLQMEIAERKLAEEKIQNLNRDLEQKVLELAESNKELEAFNRSVSHDLQTPLLVIGGFARRFLKVYGDTLDTDEIDMITTIQISAEKMERLIKDLLTFSRSGRQEIKPVKIDMRNLVRTVLDGLKTLSEGRTIKFDIKALPAAYGDMGLIKQVLVNLLSNAIKFTHSKDIAGIEVGCRVEENENIYYIKDNGIGFYSHYTDKLFSPFYRLPEAKEYEGTGIGLSIVQRIINRHGGRVWAEGKVNEGATFYFSLPNKV